MIISRVYERLLKSKSKLQKYLDNSDYKSAILLLNEESKEYIRKKTFYDRFSIATPYSNSVAEKYNLEYINASFVDRFIACQDPKKSQYHVFQDFLFVSDIKLIITLNNDYSYNVDNDSSLKMYGIKELNVRGKRLEHFVFYDWEDLSVISLEQMELIYSIVSKYSAFFTDNETLIHCKAGVGRTGTFICYCILRELKEKGLSITNEIFVDTIIKLRSERPMLIQIPKQLKYLYELFVDK